MSLSINKLEKLLGKCNLVIKTLLTTDNVCVYVETFSINNADSLYLYIPSKYEIKVDNSDKKYNISTIEINDNGTIPENFAGEPDNYDIEKKYNNIDININNNLNHDGNIVEHLEENYNKVLSLKDITKKDLNELKDIFRQLKRLGFCVQNLNYKLCITYKNYLCCIHRDDSFQGYMVQHLKGDSNRKLFVSIDLESFYKKWSSINIDMKTIKEGVYNILDKNQITHANNLHKMLQQKSDFQSVSNEITIRKNKYTSQLYQLEQLLNNLNNIEQINIVKLDEIHIKYTNDTSLKGLHSDIEKSHLLSKYQLEISRVKEFKKEIANSIILIRATIENLSLKLDKICFDNTVMLDAIIKNFVLLQQI